jgi:hypothetical protein
LHEEQQVKAESCQNKCSPRGALPCTLAVSLVSRREEQWIRKITVLVKRKLNPEKLNYGLKCGRYQFMILSGRNKIKIF